MPGEEIFVPNPLTPWIGIARGALAPNIAKAEEERILSEIRSPMTPEQAQALREYTLELAVYIAENYPNYSGPLKAKLPPVFEPPLTPTPDVPYQIPTPYPYPVVAPFATFPQRVARNPPNATPIVEDRRKWPAWQVKLLEQAYDAAYQVAAPVPKPATPRPRPRPRPPRRLPRTPRRAPRIPKAPVFPRVPRVPLPGFPTAIGGEIIRKGLEKAADMEAAARQAADDATVRAGIAERRLARREDEIANSRREARAFKPIAEPQPIPAGRIGVQNLPSVPASQPEPLGSPRPAARPIPEPRPIPAGPIAIPNPPAIPVPRAPPWAKLIPPGIAALVRPASSPSSQLAPRPLPGPTPRPRPPPLTPNKPPLIQSVPTPDGQTQDCSCRVRAPKRSQKQRQKRRESKCKKSTKSKLKKQFQKFTKKIRSIQKQAAKRDKAAAKREAKLKRKVKR